VLLHLFDMPLYRLRMSPTQYLTMAGLVTFLTYLGKKKCARNLKLMDY